MEPCFFWNFLFSPKLSLAREGRDLKAGRGNAASLTFLESKWARAIPACVSTQREFSARRIRFSLAAVFFLNRAVSCPGTRGRSRFRTLAPWRLPGHPPVSQQKTISMGFPPFWVYGFMDPGAGKQVRILRGNKSECRLRSARRTFTFH